MNTLKYRADIDGLRALAVLSVLIYHVSPQSLPGGFLGVDIFFVISGYLISLIVFRDQAAGTFSFADFYARRIRRLFPALAIVLLATIVFGAFALFADEYQRLGKHTLSAIVFLLNFQLMNEAGYFDVASDSKPLLHLWSLSIEEQFYLVWPALLVVLARFRLRIGWVIGVLIVGSFTFAIYLASRNPDTLYFHPIARFWELLLGAALAYYHHRIGINALPSGLDRSWVRHLLSCAGMIAIVSALFLFNGKAPYPGTLTLIPLLGVVVLISSGGSSAVSRFLALRPIVWIGLISYPLYLWHWPLLSFARVMESGSPPEWLLWASAGLSVALAWFTYVGVERPLRFSPQKRLVTVGLVTAMVAVFAVSLAIVLTRGFPDRADLQYLKEAKIQMKREPAQDSSCLGLFSPGEAPVYCRQNKATANMIGVIGVIGVIGDSHAHVLFPGVAKLAEKNGYGTLLLANSGCPPFVGAVTGRNADEHEKCDKSIKVIIDYLNRDKRISSVIIASRGPQYLTGKGFGPVEANYNYPPITTLSPGSGSRLSADEAFVGGLQSTSSILHERGIRVAYLLQVPELGVPARDCLGRPLRLVDTADGCLVKYEDYQVRMHPYRELIARLHSALPYLHIVDAESVFCDAKNCSGSRGGELLYADDNHLSVVGSQRLAPLILDALRQ